MILRPVMHRVEIPAVPAMLSPNDQRSMAPAMSQYRPASDTPASTGRTWRSSSPKAGTRGYRDRILAIITQPYA
jgi:hypothetical protein